jgi:tetratricopeptide (TPR) repeat protein
MFLEKRVYQGSSGRVYPLPFTDRIADRPRLREWEAIIIENEYLEITILPALGGRIHRLLDKTNGYDAIYHQPVIKPALVGLAGPWASGGIEFNWPQHHRPSTFMPADSAIERHPDGSATVWLSEHDPMARLKGMHGVRLHPGKSYLELVARAYNRTPDTQTFLWWANVATRVHEQYQSFFPPDATHVADHAKRATDTYPLSSGRYYGVDYAARARSGIPPAEIPRQFVPRHSSIQNRKSKIENDGPVYRPDDLSWYANIPVPTSYMCTASNEDFAGGYDHRAHAGLISVVNHHIAPGKKQWTWGNHEFGYAWDRNLTEPDARGEYPPYIELMVGVYTDNQPDFSHLQPGETKAWSQYWYPFRAIGPAQHANLDAALTLRVTKGRAHLGVATTTRHAGATIRLERAGRLVRLWQQTLAPDQPFTSEVTLPPRTTVGSLTLRVTTSAGRELITYTPKPRAERAAPAPATEPLPPRQVSASDELIVIAQHLEQYRHATRSPEPYWREALRRDPGDARAHLGLGRWHLRRGEFADAETHLRASIERLTSRNPNPADGEAHYQLGLCLVQQAWAAENPTAKLTAAYAVFYKATWNQAWQSAGHHALAELDARRGDWAASLDHLDRSLRFNTDNLRARNLRVIALRHLGREREAAAFLRATLALDPLDWWARDLNGEKLSCDVQVRLDLALDLARAGLEEDALRVLAGARPVTPPRGDALPDASLGTAPLLHYYRAWLCHRLGRSAAVRRHRAAATKSNPAYCFPARLEEIAILRHAIAQNPRDARAPFYLGHLLYDRRRHQEAIALWEQSVRLEPGNAIAWRNLGIGCYNVLRQPAKALHAYERAFRANPQDARLLFERDQLWKRLNFRPNRRLGEFLRHRALVEQRDDLSVELCALFNQTGASGRALPIISHRKFQPWEGGEGQALGQHVRTHLMLGRQALEQHQPAAAIGHFRAALTAPENLGEAKHLLANQSDIHFWLGTALAAHGDTDGARRHWTIAADFKGDFQTMSIRPYSEMTCYSARALEKLGRKAEARKLLRGLLAYAQQLAKAPAKIDYFATSLPTMLLFDDDLSARQHTTALFLEAQARLGLGQNTAAQHLLRTVLQRDPNHPLATDLLA